MTLFSALVFFSGFAGLVYEVVWAKALAAHWGNTAAAHAVILSVFLGGMAIGYGAIGWVSDSFKRPLRAYGLLEIAIGFCGILVPRLFTVAPAWLATAFLIVPAVLLGGTLPPIVRAAIARGASAGTSAAWLYASNSAGATLGALAAGFWMIPNFGVDLSGSLAATVNVGVGAVAVFLAGRREESPREDAISGESTPLPRVRRFAFWTAVFLSGFAALAYEIGWIRLLALSLGSSTHSFTVMLAAFVCGIAIGSLAIRSRIESFREPLTVFAFLQLGIGAVVLASTPLYERLPHLFHVLGAAVPRTEAWYGRYEAIKFLFCFAAMLPPAALLGASLPLAARTEMRSGRPGRAVGGIFGMNTAGNVLAAATAGLVLMPWLGLRGLLCGAAVLNLLAGAVVLASDVRPSAARASRFSFFCVAVGALFAVLGGPWESRALVTGGFLVRPGQPASTREEFRKFLEEFELLYHRDGANGTISVTRMENVVQLRVNGKVDASNGFDMTTQALLAHVPLLLRPEAKDALVIGLGSGVTAGAALTHPVRSVTISEISPEVVEASSFFKEENGAALEDPRVTLQVGDARAFLQGSRARYDAIISEPSNPWMAGVGDLYTREFFETARSRLNRDGVFVQWLHTYLMTDRDLRMALRTMAVVFPNVEVWSLSRDVLIVGSERPVPIDFKRTEERMKKPEVRRSLIRALVVDPAAFYALHLLDDAGARRLAGWPGPINEKGFPFLEYAAPKGVFLGRRTEILDVADARLRSDRGRGLALSRFIDAKGKLSEREFEAIFRYHWTLQSPFAGRVVEAWKSAYPARKTSN